jgi:hypothetical protein
MLIILKIGSLNASKPYAQPSSLRPVEVFARRQVGKLLEMFRAQR